MSYTYDNNNNCFFYEEDKVPLHLPQIVWVITDKCNYHCPFCFQPKTNTEININQLDSYMELFHKLGIQKIDLSGGEPLFFSSIGFLAETLRSSGFYLTVSTNGSGSFKNRNWIAENTALFSRIIISLDGSDEKQTDSLCGSKGAFSRVMSFIQLLKQKGCNTIRINTVVTALFTDDRNVLRMIDLIKEIAPFEWCLIQPHPENKLPSFDEHNITPSQFGRIVEIVRKQFINCNTNIISRSVQNYAGYWILNPDQSFLLHTDGVREPISVNFSADTIPEIISLSQKYGLWVPTII